MTKQFYLAFWSALAGLGILDWVLSDTLHIEVRNLGNELIPPAILLTLSGAFSIVFGGKYRWLSDVCHVVCLNLLGAYSTLILTYCAGTSFRPLVDSALERFDVFLGFDWLSYFRYAHDHRWLFWLFALAYASTPWQVVLSALHWASRGDRRVQEMMWMLLVGLLASIGMFWLFPAQNPLYLYGIAGTNADDWVKAIFVLRQNSGAVLDMTNPLGLISFPSYHSAVAVTMIYMHWGRSWRCALILGLNILLIASTPVIGGHYLSDTLAGILLGAGVIGLIRWRGSLDNAVSRIPLGAGPIHLLGEDRPEDRRAASRQSIVVLVRNAAAAIWAITWIIVYLAPSGLSPLWGLWATHSASAAPIDPAPAVDTLLGRVVQYGSFVPAILLFLATNVVRERHERRRRP